LTDDIKKIDILDYLFRIYYCDGFIRVTQGLHEYTSQLTYINYNHSQTTGLNQWKCPRPYPISPFLAHVSKREWLRGGEGHLFLHLLEISLAKIMVDAATMRDDMVSLRKTGLG